MPLYRGGCSCGSVRFELNGNPAWVLACHCNECKKRTGSAYGISVMVENGAVKEFTSETKTFRRKGDSGNDVSYDFCPNCATTLRWFVEHVPGRQSFAGGAFDDFEALAPIAEIYTDAAAPWARLGCDLSRGRSPDNEFRNAMVSRQREATG
jgi:hypothetical protein